MDNFEKKLNLAKAFAILMSCMSMGSISIASNYAAKYECAPTRNVLGFAKIPSEIKLAPPVLLQFNNTTKEYTFELSVWLKSDLQIARERNENLSPHRNIFSGKLRSDDHDFNDAMDYDIAVIASNGKAKVKFTSFFGGDTFQGDDYEFDCVQN